MTKIGDKEAHIRAMREGRAKVPPEQKQQKARDALAKASKKKPKKNPSCGGFMSGNKHLMTTESVIALLATKASDVEGIPPIQKDAAYTKQKNRQEPDPGQKPYIPAKYGILKRIVDQADEARGDAAKLHELYLELRSCQQVRTYHGMSERFVNELMTRARDPE